jgi:hypothetical protein
LSLTLDKNGWIIGRIWAELLVSAKHVLRDGMRRGTTEAEINALIEAAQEELTDNRYHAYYKMYDPLQQH